MVTDFAPTPMTSDSSSECFGGSRRSTAQIVGNGVLIGTNGGRGVLANDRQTADPGQTGVERFDGINLDFSLIDTPVTELATAGGKRGEPPSARDWACRRAVGWFSLS